MARIDDLRSRTAICSSTTFAADVSEAKAAFLADAHSDRAISDSLEAESALAVRRAARKSAGCRKRARRTQRLWRARAARWSAPLPSRPPRGRGRDVWR